MAGGLFDNFFSDARLGDLAAAVNKAGELIRGAFLFNPYLSDQSQQIFDEASQYAVRAGSKEIDTEHLFLALLNNATVKSIIKGVGQSPPDIQQYLLQNFVIVGTAPATVAPDSLLLSPRLKAATELAQTVARELGYNHIAPEHLLIGLAQEGEGVAAQVMAQLTINPNDLRAETLRIVGRGSAEMKSSTPRLDKYGRDLTALARRGLLDPVIGRATEIETLIEILSRRSKNNPLLIGEPGVGKTAIVEGLAQRIVEEEIPESLRGRRVIELSLNSLVAGSQYRGQFEERVKGLLDEISKNTKSLIVFIDEVHLMIGAGQAGEGAMDVANVFKPAMARGELHLIGATTLAEYQRYIEKDAALERRFQPITVPEPTVDQTIDILRGLRDRLEAHHKVRITDESIAAAAKLSNRYIANRFLPDKAIDLLDQAAARLHVAATSRPKEIQEMQSNLRRLQQEMKDAEDRNQHRRTSELRERVAAAESAFLRAQQHWRQHVAAASASVTAENVAAVLSKLTGIPVADLTAEEKGRLRGLEDELRRRVVGQDKAVKAVADAIRISRAGLRGARQPLATFLFVGSSGVGKTELAKTLAEILFGDEESIVRLDMSEYAERHMVARLVGAPPGYQGYEEGGQLTERVRRHPYSVVLLDELDKAHPDVINILLQIFDDGRLTDSRGKTVDFSNTVVIATANLPIDNEALEQNSDLDDRERLMPWLQTYFKPEFINRVGEVILFRPLDRAAMQSIVDIHLSRLTQTAREQGIELEFDNSLRDYLAEKSYAPDYGARHLNRLMRQVETSIAESVIADSDAGIGKRYVISLDEGTGRIRSTKP